MAELILASFKTQFDANAAAEKLISRGLQREQIVLTFNESIGHSPSSSTAPTTVISTVSHHGLADAMQTQAQGRESKKKHVFSDRTPTQVPHPALIGHTTMAVELRGEMTLEELRALLENGGAHSVRYSDKRARVPEDPAMWPSLGRASREDIERSIRASREGAAGKTRHGH